MRAQLQPALLPTEPKANPKAALWLAVWPWGEARAVSGRSSPGPPPGLGNPTKLSLRLALLPSRP